VNTYLYEEQAFSPGDEIRCTLPDDEFTDMAGTVVSVRPGGCALAMNNGRSLLLHPTAMRKLSKR
jgi:hypothetical protein